MDDEELALRMIQRWGLDTDRLYRGSITDEDRDAFDLAVNFPYYENVTLAGERTLSGLEARVEEYRPDMVIVDYIGLMDMGRDNSQEGTTKISRGMKALARKYAVPVICLSQLSRPADKQKVSAPTMFDLRASGALEADADQIIKTRPGEIQTIVVDSLTFYADLFFSTLDAAARSTGRTPDNRRLYQDLGAHLKDLRIRVHMLPVNVVWLALEKSADPENPIGGPMLPGQNAAKFAAGCDYIFYHRSYQIRPIDPVQWEVRTRRFGQYPAGGRDEGLLPDPLGYYGEVDDKPEPIFVTDCTYRTLAEALGINPPQEVKPTSIVPSTDNGTKKAQSGRPISASR
jgi:hypothetical protein